MNKIKQGLLLSFAALAAILGMSFAPASSTQAAPGCFSGRLCLWDGSNFSGSVISLTLPGSGGCVTLPTSPYWKDITSSYFNNSSKTVSLYDGDGCSGIGLDWINPFTYNNTLGHTNNRANSVYVW